MNLNNPLTASSLEVVNGIYQDFLLPSVVGLKYSNLKSRDGIYQVIRNVVLGGVDGQEIHLASKQHHSLMTQLKLLEGAANPHRSQFEDAYTSNPFDSVVVRCGYPIRYQDSGQVSLAHENVSVNLRLYRLDQAQYRYATISFFNELDLTPWRELLFYRIIYQKILADKQSPHFTRMYGYLLCKSTIRFDTFNKNRRDPGRLARYEESKKKKYSLRLAENQRDKGVTAVDRTVVEGISGGAVVLRDSEGRILMRRVPVAGRHPLPLPPLYQVGAGLLESGPAGTNLKAMIAASAQKALGNYIRISPEMLGESVDITTDGGHVYRVYVIQTNKFPPLTADMIQIELNKIDPSLSMFDRVTQVILRTIKSGGPRASSPALRTVSSLVERSPVSDSVLRPTLLTPEGLASSSGLSLVLVTESPTHNILQWCSKNYTSNRNVIRRMTRLGIYSDDVWFNVLFQILHGGAALFKNRMAFRNMSLDKNVFIKDLPPLQNQYWIYEMKGIQFYLPHAGYLVMFDIGGIEEDDFESKVIADEWGDSNTQEVLLRGVKKLFDHTFFSASTLPPSVNPPSERVLGVMKQINDRISTAVEHLPAPDDFFVDLIVEHFPYFYHPRVGTDLTDAETRNLKEHSPRLSELRKGCIVAMMKDYTGDAWVWVYCLRQGDPSPGMVTIAYREKDDTVHKKTISIGMIRLYYNRTIDVVSRSITNYSNESCLEHYVL